MLLSVEAQSKNNFSYSPVETKIFFFFNLIVTVEMYASLMNLCWIWKCHSSQGMIREKYHFEVIFKWLCTWISSSLKIQKGNNINNNDSNSTSPCLYWLREEISPISKLDIYFWGASECRKSASNFWGAFLWPNQQAVLLLPSPRLLFRTCPTWVRAPEAKAREACGEFPADVWLH